MNKYYCVCVGLPSAGSFTLGETYTCALPKSGPGIIVYDNHQEGFIFPDRISYQYFQFYIEHHEVPISELPDEKLFIVLVWEKPTISEIRAYAHILHVDYISAKSALSNKRTFIARGDYYYIEELCGILDQYGVKYEREYEGK